MWCLVTAATDVSNCYALVVFFFVNIILEYSITIEDSNYKLWRWLSNSIGTLNMHLEFASWYLLSCQINLNLPPNLWAESIQNVLSTSPRSPFTELSLTCFPCQERGPATNFKSQSERETFLFSMTLSAQPAYPDCHSVSN